MINLRPTCGKSSSSGLWFLNKRPCLLPKWSRLVTAVFREFSPSQQAPFFVLDIQAESGFDINVTPDKRTLFIELENDLLLILRERLSAFFEPFQGILPSCKVSLPSSLGQEISSSQKSSPETSESMPRQEVSDIERPAKMIKTVHYPLNPLRFVSVRRACELWEDSRLETVSIEDICSSRSDKEDIQQEVLEVSSRFHSNVGDDAGDVEREFNAVLTKADFESFRIQYCNSILIHSGQFNLGFIIASLPVTTPGGGIELFVIDQVYFL
jgi:DNA mismatch repair ATPase MutL